jgi:hypothetical protein
VLDDCIRAIKLWSKFLTVICFEGSLLIWLETKKHLIPFKQNDIQNDTDQLVASFDFEP